MKGNEQKAEYEEPREKARETRSEGTGRAKEAKAERAHWGSHCEAEAGRKRKGRNRELSSRRRKGSGRKEAKRKRKGPRAKA
jgi:hypothetical protein